MNETRDEPIQPSARTTLRRRLLGGLSVLSLILCLGTVALWVRSYRKADLFIASRSVGTNTNRTQIWNVWGQLSFNVEVFAPTDLDELSRGFHRVFITGWRQRVGNEPGDIWKERVIAALGFGYSVHHPGFYSRHVVWFPHWFLALLFAILPTYHLHSILRDRRRARVGLCPACGYDLRASPGRCPECGREGENDERGTMNDELKPAP